MKTFILYCYLFTLVFLLSQRFCLIVFKKSRVSKITENYYDSQQIKGKNFVETYCNFIKGNYITLN